MLCPHWTIATYCDSNHLLTPRNGRRNVLTPVHVPSIVLQCTSRSPSPSASIAQVLLGPVWFTVTCTRPCRPSTRLYPTHSSVFTTVPEMQVPATNSPNSPEPDELRTSSRTS